jgi:hypothetical protein
VGNPNANNVEEIWPEIPETRGSAPHWLLVDGNLIPRANDLVGRVIERAIEESKLLTSAKRLGGAEAYVDLHRAGDE